MARDKKPSAGDQAEQQSGEQIGAPQEAETQAASFMQALEKAISAEPAHARRAALQAIHTAVFDAKRRVESVRAHLGADFDDLLASIRDL